MAALVVLIVLVQGEQTSSAKNPASEVDYDPWKESDRPKVVVDYHRGPLRVKHIFSLLFERGSKILYKKVERCTNYLRKKLSNKACQRWQR